MRGRQEQRIQVKKKHKKNPRQFRNDKSVKMPNSTVELRKDIEEMEKEKEIVAKRIERMQRKARLSIFGSQNIS